MKVLLDTCVWGGARGALEAAGHDVVWAGDWEQDPGDDEILRLAHAEGRVLVTLDNDYGELVFLRHMRHSGIIRLVAYRAATQASVCLELLERYQAELAAGAVLTASEDRVRVRTSGRAVD